MLKSGNLHGIPGNFFCFSLVIIFGVDRLYLRNVKETNYKKKTEMRTHTHLSTRVPFVL